MCFDRLFVSGRLSLQDYRGETNKITALVTGRLAYPERTAICQTRNRMNYPKAEWLRECREAFGEAPRKLGLWERMTYLRFPTPDWLSGDALSILFSGRSRLLRDGFVTWGHFVQANNLLFHPGPHHCPADVVFSTDEARDPTPQALADVAHRLFQLKGSSPADSALAVIGRHLAAERTRAFGLQVPESIRQKTPLVISTVFVARHQLPEPRHLQHSSVPLVVSPTEPRIAMVLPGRYWSKPLLDWWGS